MSAQLSNTSIAGRNALVMQGMQASIAARVKAGVDLKSPTCIYGLCEAHNVAVRSSCQKQTAGGRLWTTLWQKSPDHYRLEFPHNSSLGRLTAGFRLIQKQSNSR